MSEIGKHILHYRKKEKYSQQDLADRICMTRQTINSWERGINEPDIDSIQTLAEIFHIQVEDLINGTRYDKKRAKLNHIMKGYLVGFIINIVFMIAILQNGIDASCIFPIVMQSFLCGMLIIIFRTAIVNDDFSMISGFDDSIVYDLNGVVDMLVFIQISFVSCYLLLTVLSYLLVFVNHYLFMPYLSLIIFIIYFITTLFLSNVRYRNQIFRHEIDRQHAKKAMPFMILFICNITICIMITLISFSIHQIKNNTLEATLLGGLTILSVMLDILFLFYTDHIIKKDKSPIKTIYIGLTLFHIIVWYEMIMLF